MQVARLQICLVPEAPSPAHLDQHGIINYVFWAWGQTEHALARVQQQNSKCNPQLLTPTRHVVREGHPSIPRPALPSLMASSPVITHPSLISHLIALSCIRPVRRGFGICSFTHGLPQIQRGRIQFSSIERRRMSDYSSNLGDCIQELKGHSGSVMSVAFSRDSELVASASEDQTVWIWRTDAGDCVQTVHVGFASHLSFEPGNARLLTDLGAITVQNPLVAEASVASTSPVMPNHIRRGGKLAGASVLTGKVSRQVGGKIGGRSGSG